VGAIARLAPRNAGFAPRNAGFAPRNAGFGKWAVARLSHRPDTL